MSRRRKRASGGGIIVLLVLIAIFGLDGLLGGIGSLIGGIGSVLIGGLSVLFVLAGFLILLFGLIYLLTKSGRTDSKYTEAKKREHTNMNPYSPNYSKEKAAQHQANAQAKTEATANTNSNNKSEQPVKEAPKHKTTGDPEIDKMIVDKDLAIVEMKRLDAAIEDDVLSAQIVHLEQVTEKIVAYIVKHPKKKNQVTKFFNYYLPTTLKLLNAYDRMDETGISGTNIDGTKEKIEDMMETALAAFDKQLDALYADEALDVSTDITVMENMLKSEGLTDDEITLHF